MSYMLLIAEPVGQRAERSQAEGKLLYESMVEFGAQLKERGLLIASESLATGGVRVKKRDGDDRRVLHARLRDEGRGYRDCIGVSGRRMVRGRGAQDRSLLGVIFFTLS
jgi:hypothetical protein